MKLNVVLTGQLAEAAGTGKAELALEEGSPLSEVVTALAERFGPGFSSLVLDGEGGVRPSLLTAVDGVQVRDLSRPLDPGAGELMLVNPMAGG